MNVSEAYPRVNNVERILLIMRKHYGCICKQKDDDLFISGAVYAGIAAEISFEPGVSKRSQILVDQAV